MEELNWYISALIIEKISQGEKNPNTVNFFQELDTHV